MARAMLLPSQFFASKDDNTDKVEDKSRDWEAGWTASSRSSKFYATVQTSPSPCSALPLAHLKTPAEMGCFPENVVIIGAGLAVSRIPVILHHSRPENTEHIQQGTALALSFSNQGIPTKIYESRAPDAPEIASGVILTPNGLQVLDKLGVFSRITSRCWKSEYRTYKNDKDETIRKVLITNESLYGYKNHRIWRRLLLAEMKLMLAERGVDIEYHSRFEDIVSEDKDRVVFRINGREEQSSMLVGADGIYSSVRKYIAPNISPEYTGVMGILTHIHRNTVTWPYPDYEPACTIQGKPGAFFTMPEDPEAREIMVGMQVKHPDQSRAEWEALSADKGKLADYYRAGYDQWHDTAKQIIDQVCANKEALYLWRFLRMPKIEKWFSETGRVLIVGDAAHAIPPSSGQGVNQALEDVHALTLLLEKSSNLLYALTKWQAMRQARIDAVFDWATNGTNVQRLPEAERQKLIAEAKQKDPNAKESRDEMQWLYQLNLDEEVGRSINTSPTKDISQANGTS